MLTCLRDLNDAGVVYVSATEAFDFSTPIGKLQLHLPAALAQIQPVSKPAADLQRAIELLETFGRVVENGTDAVRKQLFAAVLSEVYVENKKIAAIRPRPNYYDLRLFVCNAPE